MTPVRDRRWDPNDPPKDLWQALTEGWRDLRTAMRTIPTISVKTVDFTNPATSISVSVGPVSPVGVIPIGLYRVDTGAGAGVTFSWAYDSANQVIVTTSFSALAATKWRVTFLIVGAE